MIGATQQELWATVARQRLGQALENAVEGTVDTAAFERATAASATAALTDLWYREDWHDTSVRSPSGPRGRGWHDASRGSKLPA